MEERIVYFDEKGEVNTSELLNLVKDRAEARNVSKVVLASTRGETAKTASKVFEGSEIQLIVIPWQYGFGDVQPFPTELVTELETKGHLVHFSTMLFHTEKLYGSKIPEVIANTLRIFGQGMKVCTEIVMMACDGGCIDSGEKVIVIGGTASGADTAIIAAAAPSTKMYKLRVQEIICKPLLELKPKVKAD